MYKVLIAVALAAPLLAAHAQQPPRAANVPTISGDHGNFAVPVQITNKSVHVTIDNPAPPPVINVPAPVVNVPAPVVNVPPVQQPGIPLPPAFQKGMRVSMLGLPPNVVATGLIVDINGPWIQLSHSAGETWIYVPGMSVMWTFPRP